MKIRWSLVLMVASLACPLAAQQPVDYARDIKPILAEHCSRCHGPDEVNGELRLDAAATILKGGASGAAVVPGKSGESLLVKALLGAGDVLRMPPEGEGEPLSERQIALIKAWIDQGAKAPADERVVQTARPRPKSKHWAFQPVVRPALPEVRDASWPRNEIDHFILARLEKEGLAPSAEADRAALIRRVSLDLLGLPPTIEQIDQ